MRYMNPGYVSWLERNTDLAVQEETGNPYANASFYVNKDAEYAGVGFIASTIFVLLGTHHLGILGSIMLLIAGGSALFRK